ncbi:MAG: hypothetical protein OXU79_13455 [Gemmatimonadota bacterium]|nr:hypothetical protein [Gemmatimonadota bacterium]
MTARFIEHRRHSMRTKPGQHLSQAGVDLARRVGEGMTAFDKVYTSTIPRAFETGIAMGFAVDRQVELLASMPSDVEISFDVGFGGFSSHIRRYPDSVVASFAGELAAFHANIARSLPDGGRALIISHGGFIEASAVGCLPDAEHDTWGTSCNYCERVRLTYDKGKFTACEILRVPGTILLN